MTICIAGITENDKAKKLANKVVAMFAGDVIKANAILKIALDKIQNAELQYTTQQ